MVWDGRAPPGRFADLERRFPTQVHSAAGVFLNYLFLNTHARDPFDSGDARRAVAYAMDRRALTADPEKLALRPGGVSGSAAELPRL